MKYFLMTVPNPFLLYFKASDFMELLPIVYLADRHLGVSFENLPGPFFAKAISSHLLSLSSLVAHWYAYESPFINKVVWRIAIQIWFNIILCPLYDNDSHMDI